MRADLRAGIIASAGVSPWVKKGSKPPPPSAFMPDFDGQTRKKATLEEVKSIFAAAAAGFARARKRMTRHS